MLFGDCLSRQFKSLVKRPWVSSPVVFKFRLSFDSTKHFLAFSLPLIILTNNRENFMGISMVEIKEKLEKAYNDENWSIIEELLETLSYEIENGEGLFEQYKDDEEEDLWG